MTYRELGNLISCLDEDSKELPVYIFGNDWEANRETFTSKFPHEFLNIVYRGVFPRA